MRIFVKKKNETIFRINTFICFLLQCLQRKMRRCFSKQFKTHEQHKQVRQLITA